MARFINEKYADVYFVYGFCDGNSRWSEAEYHLGYSLRDAPNRALFSEIHQRLRECGSFGKWSEMDQVRRFATFNDYVVDWVEEDANVSSRILARAAVISQN